MPIILDQLNEHTKATLALSKQPMDPFKFQRDIWRAHEFAKDIERDFDKIKWFKGQIKKGHGAHEDSECYVAWHKKCALTVVATPVAHRKYQEPGEPIFAYSYLFSVSGHFSGSSATLAGAIQEAALAAIELDGNTNGSDSRWLSGKGGKMGFFEFHQVNIDNDRAFTFADLATEDSLRPVPVLEGPYAMEETPSGPTM
jgi:hypothetical protein